MVEVPSLPREFSRYIFGIKVTDGQPESKRVIQLVREGKVVKSLSLDDLERLRTDDEGYRDAA